MKIKAYSWIIIEVRSGDLVGYDARATTCAGEQLADGFYFMPDSAEDPPHRRPYATREEAEVAAREFEYEQED